MTGIAMMTLRHRRVIAASWPRHHGCVIAASWLRHRCVIAASWLRHDRVVTTSSRVHVSPAAALPGTEALPALSGQWRQHVGDDGDRDGRPGEGRRPDTPADRLPDGRGGRGAEGNPQDGRQCQRRHAPERPPFRSFAGVSKVPPRFGFRVADRVRVVANGLTNVHAGDRNNFLPKIISIKIIKKKKKIMNSGQRYMPARSVVAERYGSRRSLHST